ncbi:MAG: hypothetical protein J1E01_10790 [Acetatifactor sp.]|nr:hypothetical protein [Acetatifactor sp.]
MERVVFRTYRGRIIGFKAAENKPVVYDEDCPEMTPEMLMRFRPWQLMVKKCL